MFTFCLRSQPESDCESAIRRKSCAPYSDAYSVPLSHGISDATFCNWRSKYGGMEVSEVRRLKAPEEKNAKLKKLLAESMLDVIRAQDAQNADNPGSTSMNLSILTNS